MCSNGRNIYQHLDFLFFSFFFLVVRMQSFLRILLVWVTVSLSYLEEKAGDNLQPVSVEKQHQSIASQQNHLPHQRENMYRIQQIPTNSATD